MVVGEKEFLLKDGRKGIIRSANTEDESEVSEVLAFIKVACSETDFLLRYSEEWDSTSLEDEKRFLESNNNSDKQALLLCIVDGKVVGDCFISWNTGLKTQHRANIGISILREYWNQGIGTKLFEELISLAKSQSNLVQLELEFVEGNSRARALYEKMGFRITGLVPDAIKQKDGRLLNIYTMMRKL